MGLRVAYSVLVAGFLFYGMLITSSVLVVSAYTAAVAYAENFHGGFWFRVIWWSFVFGVRCL